MIPECKDQEAGLLHEFVVYSRERGMEVVLLNADDDVKLAGALVDHSDVDACV